MKLEKRLRKLGLVGLLAVSIASCSTLKFEEQSIKHEDGWELVKVDKSDEPEWRIFKRNEEGSSFYEYKIEGFIESSPTRCISLFKQDIYDLTNGIQREDNYEYSTYDLLAESTDTLSIYAVHNEPFPLRDTEMCIKYTFDTGTTGNLRVYWREAWDEFQVEPTSKLNRVETFRGSWEFHSTDQESYLAVNTVEFNLKGQPIWFAQPMVIKFLVRGFKRFKERAAAVD